MPGRRGKVSQEDVEVGDVTVTNQGHEARFGDLEEVEREVLLLLDVHQQAAQTPTLRRTTLEAYARLGSSTASGWATAFGKSSLRRTIGEALLSLRDRGLVDLTEAGFRLTEQGRRVLQAMEEDGETAERLQDALTSIETVRERWEAKAG